MRSAPCTQLFFPVCRFIVVLNEAHHSCVISELQDVNAAESASAVIGEQAEEQRTRDAALRRACAHCDGQEVVHPVAGTVVHF